MLDTDHLGQVVRFHREAAGLSRKALSELAGVGTTALFDVEHGKETVQLRTLLRLLEALNVEVRLESPLMTRMEAPTSPADAAGSPASPDPDAHR